jgi:hypothetical protein
MTVLLRCLLVGMLAVVCAIPRPALAVQKPGAPITITAAPGTLVRWTAPGTTRCSMLGRTWDALLETCYYLIDLLQKPAVITIARVISGHRELARISVEPFPYGTEEINLPDIPQANPSKEDLNRARRDQMLVSKAFTRREGAAKFTLPIGAPVRPLPEGKSFGVKRVFNGKPAAQPHTGSDYAAPRSWLRTLGGFLVFFSSLRECGGCSRVTLAAGYGSHSSAGFSTTPPLRRYSK